MADDRPCSHCLVISKITPRLGVSIESMGHTYGRSSIDTDPHRGVIREEPAEIKSLKCENAELKRPNAILKPASDSCQRARAARDSIIAFVDG